MKFNKWTVGFAAIAAVSLMSSCEPVMADTNTATNTTTTFTQPTAGLFDIPGISLDFLTNLPTASGFDTAKYGVGAGVAAKNGEVLNSLKGDLYLHTNWMISLEIQNAPNVLNNAGLLAGYRLIAKPSQELFVQGLIRRTLVTDAGGTQPGTQGGLSIGYGFNVMTGGKMVSCTEFRMLTSPHGPVLTSTPPGEVVTYVKMLF